MIAHGCTVVKEGKVNDSPVWTDYNRLEFSNVDRPQPPETNLHQRSYASDYIPPGQSESGEVQIIPISPISPGIGEREEINMDGPPYLAHRDTLEDFDDDVEFASVDNARRGKDVESGDALLSRWGLRIWKKWIALFLVDHGEAFVRW